ncbi:facilitated trehalose transporter Tret1-like [Bicyclus anynana]|uniref:Facilitated trehalose transporter Tret1-like n=1 Tax=Bicyclus anynana TaxID=110368 RepID=A0ABM3M0K1_BICAN|nr:facilitated trehalose transporter Tret1-like [Bicyclus anynana]
MSVEETKYAYTIVEQDKVKMDSSSNSRSIKFQLLIVACINIGQIIVGYSVGWSAPIIPKLQDPDQTPLPDLITDFQASWIGSLLYIGAMVGPYGTGFLSNHIGRRPCLMIGAVLNIVAYILVVTTTNLAMIYAIRIVSGLGMGITIVGNIVYVGEIASTHIRGILLTSTSIVGITGTLIVYAVVPFVSYVATGWIALAICLLHIVSLFFIPESPVYYAMKNEDVKTAKTLHLLGRSSDVQKILETYSNKKKASSLKDWIEIFTIKSNRWSLFITFMLGALQQLSGVAVVLFFATTIFELAGSSIRSDIATIIIGVTRLVSSLIAPLFIERSGRKILLLCSMMACALSLAVLGLYFYLDRIQSDVLENIGWLPLFALIIYFFCYEAGFGTIPNAIVGEMFRANVRSNGSSLAITLTWLVGFALTTSFTTMVENLGGDVTFWIFGGSCVFSFLFTLFCVPETKGMTLKEIQDMLS